MSVAHDPWIVALSILVAIQGTYVALGLTPRINQRAGLARRLALAGAAFTFAAAIWSMHFVGMLAMRPAMRLDYLLLPSLLSLLLCIVVMGAAVFVGSLAPVRRWALPVAAVIMGVGITGMHYVGMTALHGRMVMHDDWRFVLGSFAVAIAAAVPGLRLAFLPRSASRPILAATVLGVAISGMHYVGMAGMTLQPLPPAAGLPPPAALSLSPDVLAVVVALAAFAVSAVFLLTLVPDQAPAPVRDPAPAYDSAFAWNARTAYVGMTRHRAAVNLYVPQSLAADELALGRQMSRRMRDEASLAYATEAEVVDLQAARERRAQPEPAPVTPPAPARDPFPKPRWRRCASWTSPPMRGTRTVLPCRAIRRGRGILC